MSEWNYSNSSDCVSSIEGTYELHGIEDSPEVPRLEISNHSSHYLPLMLQPHDNSFTLFDRRSPRKSIDPYYLSSTLVHPVINTMGIENMSSIRRDSNAFSSNFKHTEDYIDLEVVKLTNSPHYRGSDLKRSSNSSSESCGVMDIDLISLCDMVLDILSKDYLLRDGVEDWLTASLLSEKIIRLHNNGKQRQDTSLRNVSVNLTPSNLIVEPAAKRLREWLRDDIDNDLSARNKRSRSV